MSIVFDASIVRSDYRGDVDFVGNIELSDVLEKTLPDETVSTHRFDGYFRERNAIGLGLKKLLALAKNGNPFPSLNARQDMYIPFAFLRNVMQMLDLIPSKARNSLRGRILDGLSTEGGIRELDHEFRVANAFWNDGWKLTPIDCQGAGRFDFLAEKSSASLEIECKTVKPDTGPVRPEHILWY
jgi:hypothetical protein